MGRKAKFSDQVTNSCGEPRLSAVDPASARSLGPHELEEQADRRVDHRFPRGSSKLVAGCPGRTKQGLSRPACKGGRHWRRRCLKGLLRWHASSPSNDSSDRAQEILIEGEAETPESLVQHPDLLACADQAVLRSGHFVRCSALQPTDCRGFRVAVGAGCKTPHRVPPSLRQSGRLLLQARVPVSLRGLSWEEPRLGSMSLARIRSTVIGTLLTRRCHRPPQITHATFEASALTTTTA